MRKAVNRLVQTQTPLAARNPRSANPDVAALAAYLDAALFRPQSKRPNSEARKTQGTPKREF